MNVENIEKKFKRMKRKKKIVSITSVSIMTILVLTAIYFNLSKEKLTMVFVSFVIVFILEVAINDNITSNYHKRKWDNKYE